MNEFRTLTADELDFVSGGGTTTATAVASAAFARLMASYYSAAGLTWTAAGWATDALFNTFGTPDNGGYNPDGTQGYPIPYGQDSSTSCSAVDGLSAADMTTIMLGEQLTDSSMGYSNN